MVQNNPLCLQKSTEPVHRFGGLFGSCVCKGEDLEGSALETPQCVVSQRTYAPLAAQRGRVPLDSHLLGVIGEWNFGSCLADTPCGDDRPPTQKNSSSRAGYTVRRRKSRACSVTLGTFCKGLLCAPQELPRTQEGAFFFTKKAYCGNQTVCVTESRKSVQTCSHNHFRP